MDSLMKEVGELQEKYQNLIKRKILTKKSMCELVIPFRDKYKLTDLQALKIARNELSIREIYNLVESEE